MIIIKSLFKAVATLSIFSVASRFLGFIFKIILSRNISTTALGVYSVATSVCAVFLTALSSGLPLTVSRRIAQSKVDKNKQLEHQYVSSGLLISVLMSIIVTASILLLKPVFNKLFADPSTYLVILTLIPMLVACGLYAPVKGYLWGHEKFFQVSIVEFFEQFIKIIIFIVIFPFVSNKVLPAGLTLSISCIFSTLLGYFIYFKEHGKLTNPYSQIRPILSSSTPLTAIRMAGSLLAPLVSIVLPLQLIKSGYTMEQTMSELGVAMGMTFPLLTIPTTIVGSLAMALIPKLTTLQKQNDNFTLKKQINNSITFTMFCSFIFIPIFYSLGVPLCQLLFKNLQAGYFLQNFAWLIVPMGLSQITSSTLNSLGEEKFVCFSYFISALTIIFSLFVLPQYLGTDALMWGLAIHHTTVTLINLIRLKNKLKLNSDIVVNFIKFAIISVILSATSNWLYLAFSGILHSTMQIVLLGLFNLAGYIALTYALNIANFSVMIQSQKHKKV